MFSGRMSKRLSKRYFLWLAGICTFASFFLVWWQWQEASSVPDQQHGLYALPQPLEERRHTITRIRNSAHLMVSAFQDHRRGGAIRVIGIIKREELQQLYCVLCIRTAAAGDLCGSSEAQVEIHSDHFDFPYGTSDILCSSPWSTKATHVSITTDPRVVQSLEYLPIQNKEQRGESFKYDFTVCISNLFGDFDNALQVVQTMEVYKLLGVERVVMYNTSCGPALEKALQRYKREGLLEVVDWPIDKFLKPSHGWKPSISPGDLHYYGQLTTLNECIYRHMYQSRYLLLNDIDEIIMPYEHASLGDLMDALQEQYPDAGVFKVENPIFPKTQFDDSGRFSRPEWKGVPGLNILEHIYREPELHQNMTVRPFKMIVDPRRVEQTSVHTPLKHFGPFVYVPFNVSHIIHVRSPLQRKLSKEQLIKDDKLWEFEQELIPNVNRVLKESGLL
ncbi:uncharacterized protein LOC134445785 [Engraulis encrasicolus]|uniref:uncharacterized protein LOC134445785 n=1 Tax=Engraulis encrasicolus TaxID=184585 RepID=UPI002FCF7D15